MLSSSSIATLFMVSDTRHRRLGIFCSLGIELLVAEPRSKKLKKNRFALPGRNEARSEGRTDVLAQATPQAEVRLLLRPKSTPLLRPYTRPKSTLLLRPYTRQKTTL